MYRQSILTAVSCSLQGIGSYDRFLFTVWVKLDNIDESTNGLQKSSEASQLPTLLENVSLEFLNRSVLMSLISVLINIL